MDKILLHINSKVVSADIRHFEHNGRPHIALPSYTLPDEIIMNGGLYTHDEIEKCYQQFEGTLAPIGHPMINGKHVLALEPEAINAHHVGVFNRNVERVGNRIYMEKWVDVETAQQSELGRELLDRIDKGLPLHTSMAAMAKREMVANAGAYSWIARDMKIDHDAILFHEPGAATPEQGVGLLVNSSAPVVGFIPDLAVNAVLENSYGQRRNILSAAISERFAVGEDWAYVDDFDDSSIVFSTREGLKAVGYTWDMGNPILGDEVTPVVIKTEFVAKGAEVGTSLALVKNAVQCEPVQNKPEPQQESIDMDKAELTSVVTELLGNALAPLATELASLKAAHGELSTQLTVNAKAEAEKADKEHRAAILAAKPELELVANALTGDALVALAASLNTAAPLHTAGKSFQTNAADDEFAAYKGAQV